MSNENTEEHEVKNMISLANKCMHANTDQCNCLYSHRTKITVMVSYYNPPNTENLWPCERK